MTKLKKGLALALTAALTSALPVVAAPAAHAAESNCSTTYVCRYENEYFEGRRLSFYDWLQTYNLTDWAFNDQTSSWHNNQESDAIWHEDINLGGTGHCMQAWTKSTQMGWWSNDHASSLIIYTDGNAC